MKLENDLHIYPDATTLIAAAADFIINIAKEAILQRGRFSIALSGGHTPEGLYTLLSTPLLRNEIPWDKTFIFWGDERCVPPNDLQNNAYMARETLLDQISIPQKNIFPIHYYVDPAKAATRYENTIKEFFGSGKLCFDLILLGLGENGHTASLFPGNENLLKGEKIVECVYVAEQKMYRITMTPQLINQAAHIIFLITGKEKANILKKVLSGPYQPEDFPAQIIHPTNGKLYWLIDHEAASLLPKHT